MIFSKNVIIRQLNLAFELWKLQDSEKKNLQNIHGKEWFKKMILKKMKNANKKVKQFLKP